MSHGVSMETKTLLRRETEREDLGGTACFFSFQTKAIKCSDKIVWKKP